MTDPAVRIREAFRYVALGLMAWTPPPPAAPWDKPVPTVYRCWDKQGDVEPFDLDADDRECWEGH